MYTVINSRVRIILRLSSLETRKKMLAIRMINVPKRLVQSFRMPGGKSAQSSAFLIKIISCHRQSRGGEHLLYNLRRLRLFRILIPCPYPYPFYLPCCFKQYNNDTLHDVPVCCEFLFYFKNFSAQFISLILTHLSSFKRRLKTLRYLQVKAAYFDKNAKSYGLTAK